MRRLAALGLAGLLGAAVALAVEPDCETVRSTTLYLGRDIPGGGRVARRAWRRFLAEVVAPAAPGFTAWSTTGGWADGPRATLRTEPAFALQIVHDGGVPVRDIAAAWVGRFRQTEVLVVETSGCAASVRKVPDDPPPAPR